MGSKLQPQEIPVLTLRDQLDSGTCFRLPTALRKIIGGYVGMVFQTNFAAAVRFFSDDDLQRSRIEAFSRLAVGDSVDAKDQYLSWYEAQIIERSEDQWGEGTRIMVHYKGWSTKWDEWFNLSTHSDRLAVQGTHSAAPRFCIATPLHKLELVLGYTHNGVEMVPPNELAKLLSETTLGKCKIALHHFIDTSAHVIEISDPTQPQLTQLIYKRETVQRYVAALPTLLAVCEGIPSAEHGVSTSMVPIDEGTIAVRCGRDVVLAMSIFGA